MSSPDQSQCAGSNDGVRESSGGGMRDACISSDRPTLLNEIQDVDIGVRAHAAVSNGPTRPSLDTPESSDDESTSSVSSSSSSASSRSMSTVVSEASASSSSGSVLSSDDDGDDNDGRCHSSDNDEDLTDLEDRMKRKFAGRDKLLKTIARKNKGNRAYVDFLRRNEADVRAEAMKILEEKKQMQKRRRKQRRENNNNSASIEGCAVGDSTKCTKSPSPSPFTKAMVARLVRFEFYHTSGGFVTLFLYCFAHISVYELMSNIFLECTRHTQQSQQMVYTLVLVFALILSRLSGGIFVWVAEDTYASVKFDVHNRLRLADFDVLILRWFRRHPAIKYASDIVSLYLCFMSVSYFLQYWVLPTLLDTRDEILSSLPSMQFDFCRTRLQEMLGDGLSSSCSSIDLSEFIEERVCFDDSNTVSESGPYCYDATELGKVLTEEDWEFFAREVSVSSMYSFVGDSQTALTRPAGVIFFYAACAAFSITFLAKFYKFRFW
eukprot:CAMPEP_0181032738 /NCGR_PEP_ID=MMETSP1070-20121207/6893_1 /TAXON_ID=265543 /ORGANISM="Minutocellus polymorphus, Strain NH13" /LENGTH=492 /DNA_ID=CAMNT_0023110137 /DNA_START=150 /DNA_END=1625 /DNA_ORIENTATION=+